MHYRNGREAKNGDHIVQIADKPDGGGASIIVAIGLLHGAVAGNDHCNGQIIPIDGGTKQYACLCDCLHMDDISDMINEKGLAKRPLGK